MLLMLCCNDPDNGQPVGRVAAIEISTDHEHLMTIELDEPNPTMCYLHEHNRIKISRRKFRVHGYSAWVGNWCWDAVHVTPEIAAQIINYVRPKAHCTEGVERLFDLFNEGKDITVAQLQGNGEGR